MIGQTVAHYKILEKIGEGGMGVVYRAHDTKLERDVALKFLSLDFTGSEELKERFIQEAKAASVLDHPNICTIHAIDETDDGRLFIAMGYYPGKTVKERLREGPLDSEEIVDLAAQIAEGLKAAHEHGIIHMDVKPANLMVTPEGTVKILDFGLSRFTSEIDRTRPKGPLMGTVAYMSPEQVQGEKTGPESDLWALGVVMYEMATGTRPFQGKNDMAVLYSIVHREIEPPIEKVPELAPELDQIIRQSLVKDRRYRYPDSSELLAELEPLNQRSGTQELPWISRRDWQRQKLVLRFTAVVALLILAVLVYFLFRPPASEPAPTTVVMFDFDGRSSSPELAWVSPALAEVLVLKLPDDDLRWVRDDGRSSDPGAHSPEAGVSFDSETGLVPAKLAEVRRQTSAAWVIGGSYRGANDGGAVRLDAEVVIQETFPRGSVHPFRASGNVDDTAYELASALAPILGTDPPPLADGRIDPTQEKAQRLLSEARERLILLDAHGARSRLEEAESLEPGNALVGIYLADALWQLGHEDDARDAAAKAVAAAVRLPYRILLFVQALRLEIDDETEESAALLDILWSSRDQGGGGGEAIDRFDLGLRRADAQQGLGDGEGALETLVPLGAAQPEHPRIALIRAEVASRRSLLEGQKLFAEAAELAQQWKATVLAARALMFEGQEWFWLGEVDEGVQRIEQARDLYVRERHKMGEADTLKVLGNLRWRRQELLDAKNHYQEAVQIYGSIGSHSGKADALSNQGRVLIDRGDLIAGIQLLQQAQELYGGPVNNPVALAVTLLNLADAQAETGELDVAEETIGMALKIPEIEQDLSNKTLLLSLHGWLRILRGDLAAADQNLSLALAIQEKTGDLSSRAVTFYFRAYLLRLRGAPEEAAQSSEQAARLFMQTGSLPYYARAQTVLGETRTLQGQFDEARVALRTSLEIQDQLPNPLWFAQTRISSARLLIEQDRPDEAQSQILQALTSLSNSPADLLIAEAHTVLAESLLAQGDLEGAESSIGEARRRLEPIEAPVYDIPLEIVAARIAAARGNVKGGLDRLQPLLADTAGGLVALELEIRLAQGVIQLDDGQERARALLRDVATEAGQKGYGLIERKALAAAQHHD